MDKIKYKAVTPNLLVSEDGKILIEKFVDNDRHVFVSFYHDKLTEPARRLFSNEREADDFVKYLTDEL